MNPNKPNYSPPDVLLVEDNPRDAELTLRALKSRRFVNNIVHVQDGAEALDFLFGTGAYSGRDTRAALQVVLLDIKLPKVDGLEVLRRMKADERTKSIPIVMLTSSQEQRDVMESYQLGVNSYIVKPVEFDSFSAAVSELGCYWMLLNVAPQ